MASGVPRYVARIAAIRVVLSADRVRTPAQDIWDAYFRDVFFPAEVHSRVQAMVAHSIKDAYLTMAKQLRDMFELRLFQAGVDAGDFAFTMTFNDLEYYEGRFCLDSPSPQGVPHTLRGAPRPEDAMPTGH